MWPGQIEAVAEPRSLDPSARLRHAREQRGLSLRQVAEATKLSVRALNADVRALLAREAVVMDTPEACATRAVTVAAIPVPQTVMMRSTRSPTTIAAVMGIMGYTHGVRLVSSPATNSAGTAVTGLAESRSAIWVKSTGGALQ